MREMGNLRFRIQRICSFRLFLYIVALFFVYAIYSLFDIRPLFYPTGQANYWEDSNVAQTDRLSWLHNLTELRVLDYTAINHGFHEVAELICDSGKVFWTKDRSKIESAHVVSFHLHQMPYQMPKLKESQLSLVYVMESERNSPLSMAWQQMDFALWYHLDKSFPFPITYFDISGYMLSLMCPMSDEGDKRKGIIWICSNCHALNGRARIVRALMHFIPVHSAGLCLNNIPRYPRSMSKLDIYKKYKYVIAIENSNCQDYVTEKFTEAISANAVPIVAGFNGMPDYRRFAPNGSFVNIGDFSSIEKLADYLNESLNDDRLFLERHFKHKRLDAFESIDPAKTNELVSQIKKIFPNESFSHQLLTKETGKNKYCKLLEFLQNPKALEEIETRGKRRRPSWKHVCLPDEFWINKFIL